MWQLERNDKSGVADAEPQKSILTQFAGGQNLIKLIE